MTATAGSNSNKVQPILHTLHLSFRIPVLLLSQPDYDRAEYHFITPSNKHQNEEVAVVKTSKCSKINSCDFINLHIPQNSAFYCFDLFMFLLV